jgi:ABC-type dipeptide/oligopeptide/nickel transport system permease subunit
VTDARRRSRFARSLSARLGGAIVGVLVLFTVLAPALARHDPYASDFVHGIAPETGLPVGPSAEFPLGTDRIFRDVLSRLAWGGRVSLTIAVAATLLATVVGGTVGILAGYNEGRRILLPWPAAAGIAAAFIAALLGRPLVGGLVLVAGLATSIAFRFAGPPVDVDAILMRFVDVMLAFPFLLLVMAIGAALERTSAVTIFATLGLTGWLGTARLVRAKTMQIRGLEFVLASRALGQPTVVILLKHILPNMAGPLTALATMQVAQMIVADSILSYLGLGIAPPTPTWGRMLFEGQDYWLTAPWLVLAPGTAILLAVWGFNLLGEGLRDALDPREV